MTTVQINSQMAEDIDWTHHYCLSCETQTDYALYCSQACRLADYEKLYLPSSPVSSTYSLGSSPSEWTVPKPTNMLQLLPPVDFSSVQQKSKTTNGRSRNCNWNVSFPSKRTETGIQPFTQISPVSSVTSLYSFRSATSSTSSYNIRTEAIKALQEYDRRLELGRLHRSSQHISESVV